MKKMDTYQKIWFWIIKIVTATLVFTGCNALLAGIDPFISYTFSTAVTAMLIKEQL